MAYNQNNLFPVGPAALNNTKPRLWIYSSADTFTTVKASGYISNAYKMGVRPRDILMIIDTATPATTLSNVLTCTAAPACTTSQTGVVIAE